MHALGCDRSRFIALSTQCSFGLCGWLGTWVFCLWLRARYRSTYDGLREADGNVSVEEAMDLLEVSSQSSTIWSIVHNLDTREIRIVMGRKYGNALTFQLPFVPD